MNDLDLQLRSIRYAIKELHKERARAINTDNHEWVEDCDKHIKNLEGAINTIEAAKAMIKAFGSAELPQ